MVFSPHLLQGGDDTEVVPVLASWEEEKQAWCVEGLHPLGSEARPSSLITVEELRNHSTAIVTLSQLLAACPEPETLPPTPAAVPPSTTTTTTTTPSSPPPSEVVTSPPGLPSSYYSTTKSSSASSSPSLPALHDAFAMIKYWFYQGCAGGKVRLIGNPATTPTTTRVDVRVLEEVGAATTTTLLFDAKAKDRTLHSWVLGPQAIASRHTLGKGSKGKGGGGGRGGGGGGSSSSSRHRHKNGGGGGGGRMMEQGPPLPPDDRCRVFGHVNIWRQVEEEEEEGDGEKRMEEYVEKMVTHVDKALVMITMLDGDEVLATTTTSSGGGSSSNTLVKMVSDDGGEEQKERRRRRVVEAWDMEEEAFVHQPLVSCREVVERVRSGGLEPLTSSFPTLEACLRLLPLDQQDYLTTHLSNEERSYLSMHRLLTFTYIDGPKRMIPSGKKDLLTSLPPSVPASILPFLDIKDLLSLSCTSYTWLSLINTHGRPCESRSLSEVLEPLPNASLNWLEASLRGMQGEW